MGSLVDGVWQARLLTSTSRMEEDNSITSEAGYGTGSPS